MTNLSILRRSIARRAIASRTQRGIVLLEALIAVVIFGFGVLGLLGLQANSSKESASAKFRSDASLLANELIGKMWAGNRSAAALQTAYASPSGTEFTKWKTLVQAALPMATDTPAPTVTIAQVAGAPGKDPTNAVTITLSWQAPYETTAHHYTVAARIR